jgi:putative glutamine amidotransferase
MPKPLIGISTDYTDALEQDDRFSESTYYLKENYAAAVEAGGGIPVLLPAIGDIPSLMDRIEGLVISGGNFDIDPCFYKEKKKTTTRSINPKRSKLELALICEAWNRDIPLLGICGGEQALNVTLGGTLIQDILSELGPGHQHEQKDPNTETSHSVFIDDNSLLYKIMGDTVFEVNSTHHQAIKKVAPSLKTVAFSEDGVIEAVEAKEKGFCLGVQWHPEALFKKDDRWLKLFSALVEAAS